MKMKLLFWSLILSSWSMVASAQNVVSGTVTDKKGNPIPGAKVEIPETEESVLTDLDGTFSLSTSVVPSFVKVYYVGMQSKKQRVSPDMQINLSKTTWWNQKPESWQFFASAQGAFPESGMKNPAFGLTIGYVKTWGVYAKALYSTIPSTECEWNDLGSLKPWTIGENKSGMQAYIVGGMIRLGCALYLNLGVGYMNRAVAWKLSDGSWAKYNDDSYSGICIDGGLTLRCGNHFMLNGGILTGTGSARAPYVGIGYCF